MGNGKHVGRKTNRIVRTPATRLGHLKKRLRQASLPPAGVQTVGHLGHPKKHK